MGIRTNSKGKLFTEETEYIKAFDKSWSDEGKRITENVRKKRGRPKKQLPTGVTFTRGEYLITFE